VPFLRVLRDKRGYETTYLVHWFRDGNRQQSKVLYVFRTPGGVRVGRTPLDPAVLREIEASHPDIPFDWPAVFDNRQVVDVAPDMRRPRRRTREDEPAAEAASAPPPAAPVAAAPPATPRFVVPATIEGDTPDAQVAFLARWYVSIREQVLARTSDPSRREALLALTERLNTVAWTDADEITAGLPQAAEALERLSHVFARRRRRSRGNRRDASASPDSVSAGTPTATPPVDAEGPASE
jgi:hypothetical protein